MEIVKGNQYTVKAKFTRRGQPATFTNPPVWTMYNKQDDELLTGTATWDAPYWLATFTVPTTYIVPGGKEELLVQFSGHDDKNNSYVLDRELTLIDQSENFRPIGLIYDAITQGPILDTIVSDSPTISFTAALYDPTGVQIGPTISETSVAAVNSTSLGYEYPVSFPAMSGILKNKFLDPYNIVYQITENGKVEVEIHPVYILDFKTLAVVNNLKTTLDKANLTEIDPTLQWNTMELIQAVWEGVKRINGAPPEGTFWNLTDFPNPLDRYLSMAAAVFALDARYLAEGLNAFQFAGLNTTLDFNRTEYIGNLRDQYNGFLDGITPAKTSAIRIAGKGIPPVGQVDLRVQNVGTLGLTINPLNNVRGYGRHGRFNRLSMPRN